MRKKQTMEKMGRKLFIGQRFLTVITIFLVFLVGCSASHYTTYIDMVNINGSVYEKTGSENMDYEQGELIGEIKKQLKAQKTPKRHLHSNYLNVGTKVYEVNGEENLVVANSELFKLKER